MGYLNDIAIYPLARDTAGFWDGSKAQEQLKEDMSNKYHEQLKPKSLWQSRPEYQEFDLQKFRGHIHQELRRSRETNYWIVRKKKKEKANQAKRDGTTMNDEDMEFLYDPILDM